MATDDPEGSILQSGAAALLECGKMSGIVSENEIPEKCLQVHMASHLIDEFGWDARLEVSNTKMLRELGHAGDEATKRDLEGYHADIVRYLNDTPVAIIEVKKVLKAGDVEKVWKDAEKLCKLSKRVQIKCYLGLAIFDDVRVPVTQQVRRLEARLDHQLRIGPIFKDFRTDNWEWCFGCVTVDLAKFTSRGLPSAIDHSDR